jgi:hypothetical protein
MTALPIILLLSSCLLGKDLTMSTDFYSYFTEHVLRPGEYIARRDAEYLTTRGLEISPTVFTAEINRLIKDKKIKTRTDCHREPMGDTRLLHRETRRVKT